MRKEFEAFDARSEAKCLARFSSSAARASLGVSRPSPCIPRDCRGCLRGVARVMRKGPHTMFIAPRPCCCVYNGLCLTRVDWNSSGAEHVRGGRRVFCRLLFKSFGDKLGEDDVYVVAMPN